MNQILSFPEPKRPIEVLDYSVDWTAWLAPAADAIVSVDFAIAPFNGTAQTGDCVVMPATPPFNGGITTCWITQGVAGTSYSLVCTITTVGSGGEQRIAERSVLLGVV